MSQLGFELGLTLFMAFLSTYSTTWLLIFYCNSLIRMILCNQYRDKQLLVCWHYLSTLWCEPGKAYAAGWRMLNDCRWWQRSSLQFPLYNTTLFCYNTTLFCYNTTLFCCLQSDHHDTLVKHLWNMNLYCKCMRISQMTENRAGYLTWRGFGVSIFLQKYEGSLNFQIYSTCYKVFITCWYLPNLMRSIPWAAFVNLF